jgi:hypothetical protein
MSNHISLNIDQNLYDLLELNFKNDEQAIKQFIIDAIRSKLMVSDTLTNEHNNLESYLKKGSSGSRTYGVKGQGW